MDELRDEGRVRMTELADQFLVAEARVTGKSKALLIREIVHAHALREIERAEMVCRLTRGVKGTDGESEG